MSDDLAAAEDEVAACRRARHRVELLAEQIAHEQHACRALRERLADERDDVEALEQISVASLLARARGRLDDRLRRERADVAEVEVELAARQRALARLSAEFEAARDRSLELDTAQSRLDAALAERERRLAAGGGEAARRLAELDARLAAERAARTEIVEAHLAALGADGALDMAIRTMSSANDWSGIDTFANGEWVASALKHEHLDRAVDHNAEAHAALITLRVELGELADAVHHPNLSGPSPTLLTIDKWFDNEISDYLAHRKINRSLQELRRSHAGVREIVAQLQTEERIATERVARLEAERALLLRG